MARLARLTLPGYPHHVIQRGNNRQLICIDDQDFEQLLRLLTETAAKHGVALHAYVLMGNHFHLLATPKDIDSIPLAMQALGRSYVRYFNNKYQRTGTLWEGRYRSTLIQTERYLLACMAYIDLNPVRAGMVQSAGDYRWSSHAHYCGRGHERLITPHPLYWEMGNTPFAREAAYEALVRSGIDNDKQRALTDSTLRGWALGDEEFVSDLQGRTARRVTVAKAGRPRKVVLEPV